MSESERVQKVLAKAGISSRRKAEALIREGAVTINGKIAKLGDKAVFGEDAIKVNGKLLLGVQEKVYIAFNKPRAVISMLVDNEKRPNLSNYLAKVRTRVFPIGRLDFNSEGLILLTNDGDFAEKLQKRDDIPRVYTVKVKGKADADAIRRLEKGAKVDFRMVRPHSVRLLRELEAKSQVQIVILGGGATDIRAMCEMKGLLVDKITRTAIGHLTLKGLPSGHYRFIKQKQAEALLDMPELGLKLLEQEVEDEKPKGQRNVHDKKITPVDPDATTSGPTTRSRAEAPSKPARPARSAPVAKSASGAEKSALAAAAGSAPTAKPFRAPAPRRAAAPDAAPVKPLRSPKPPTGARPKTSTAAREKRDFSTFKSERTPRAGVRAPDTRGPRGAAGNGISARAGKSWDRPERSVAAGATQRWNRDDRATSAGAGKERGGKPRSDRGARAAFDADSRGAVSPGSKRPASSRPSTSGSGYGIVKPGRGNPRK